MKYRIMIKISNMYKNDRLWVGQELSGGSEFRADQIKGWNVGSGCVSDAGTGTSDACTGLQSEVGKK